MKDKTKYIGQRFNEWTILEVLPNRKLKCRCSCGKVKEVAEYSVISGKSTNCGHIKYGEDITGQVFGELTVLGKSKNSCHWLCRCSCGREVEVTKYELTHGRIKCSSKHESLAGKKFNKLTVIEFDTVNKLWDCECECGEHRLVSTKDLKSDNIKSCKTCANTSKKKEVNTVAEKSEPVKRTELIGGYFGELEVIDFNIKSRLWICKCSCGKTKEVRTYDLTHHRVRSCGHFNNKPKVDLAGEVIEELTVNSYIGNGQWRCTCSCGKETVATTTSLIRGYKKSCGHLKDIDITGKQIGELTVLGRDPDNSGKWLCKCSCGKKISLKIGHLGPKGYKSCGHIKNSKFINLLGQQFGELKVIEYTGYQRWKCLCSCGNTVEVLGHNLRQNTRSCGCKALEFYNSTMLEKYGDTSSKHIDTPREDWQIEVLAQEDLFKQYILELEKMSGHKQSAYDIAKHLGVTPATINNYAYKYGVLLRKSVSSFEDEITQLFPNFKQHNRKILDGLELDFFDKEQKVAIEFNGTYWHSSLFKDRNYHQNKTIQCTKQGIQLIHIFEHEWINDNLRDKIITIICNTLNISDHIVIYGRSTKIKNISKDTADTFLINNHLNGTSNSSIRLGCYLDDKLLGVMTFGKPRFNSNYQYEIVRLAWLPDYRVIGGTQKLFNSFIEQYNPDSVITYCDISKFKGNVYTSLGFTSDEVTQPNYVWVHKYKQLIKNRYETQKHILIKEYPNYVNMTEDEIMMALGYVKVYNCGNLKLSWYKTRR